MAEWRIEERCEGSFALRHDDEDIAVVFDRCDNKIEITEYDIAENEIDFCNARRLATLPLTKVLAIMHLLVEIGDGE